MNHKLIRIRKQEYFKLQHRLKFNSLTRREVEILGLLVKGLDSPKIATKLFISRHTVQQHRKNINQKLEINSQFDLYQFALAFDLI